MILQEISLQETPKILKFQQHSQSPKEVIFHDYLYLYGDIDLAISFAKLFFPTIIHTKGCFIRQEGTLVSKFQSINEAKSLEERQTIEKACNDLLIHHLFEDDGSRMHLSLDAEESLAKTLLLSWEFTLKHTFPNQEFLFFYTTSPKSYGPAITFCQK